MSDRVVIVLPGLGSLELTREQYDAALRPIVSPVESAAAAAVIAPELVTAGAIALTLSLPISCIYQYAKAGRIPCVRAGRHVRFNLEEVLAALRGSG